MAATENPGIDEIALRMAEGVYEPGAYVKKDDVRSSGIKVAPGGGSASFDVWTSVDGADREEYEVVIRRVR